MKKVININFQGRVIPIEETAYDTLNKYVESLRLFFATEEGRDEIINDIEGRIAELFAETLQKGSTCITDADVENIIASMGRPEDFEADEDKVHARLDEKQHRSEERSYHTTGAKGLYRDENNKFLGGVCAGIAHYFNIDPIIIRVLFVLFSGITFIPYLILWIAVPSSSSLLIGSQRKRLFRDLDNKIIAGVCSGLAAYFAIPVWIPRLLFLIPFFSFVFRWGHWGWFDFPHFLSFSFSPGAVFIYVILWLVTQPAKTAADKLEMKGEKVDLNNIKTTIQGDLDGFKGRAQQFGTVLATRAQEMGAELGTAGKRFGEEAGAVGKKTGKGVGNLLAVILKIFIYFILGSIVFAITAGMFVGAVVVTGLLPAYSYVLEDGLQKLLVYGTLIFFIWIPVVGLVTWIIRKLAGKKRNSNILTLTFISLWILGWVCFINLIVSLRSEFKYRNYPTEQPVALSNPGVDKLEVRTSFGRYYTNDWFDLEPFNSFSEDTVFVRNVRVRLVKVAGDSFQVNIVRMANGSSKTEAENNVRKIGYNVIQQDTSLLLDKGIAITKNEKFRNQQVIVTVGVPVGKKIMVHENVGWGNVRVDVGNNDDYWDWENSIETVSMHYQSNVEYIMTEKGLERVNKPKYDEDDDENSDNETIEDYRRSREQMEREKEQKLRELEELERELQEPADTTRYRYRPAPDTSRQVTKTKTLVALQSNRGVRLPEILMAKFFI